MLAHSASRFMQRIGKKREYKSFPPQLISEFPNQLVDFGMILFSSKDSVVLKNGPSPEDDMLISPRLETDEVHQ